MKTILRNDKDGDLVQITLDIDHHSVHLGRSFKAITGSESLASAGTKTIAFKTLDDEEHIHLNIMASGSALAKVEFFEAPIITADTGTHAKWVNKKRDSLNLIRTSSIETTPQEGYYSIDPTITDVGTIIDPSNFIGGSKQTGLRREEVEWELSPNTIYAVRLTSLQNSNAVNIALYAIYPRKLI